jgi:hypothetical protein
MRRSPLLAPRRPGAGLPAVADLGADILCSLRNLGAFGPGNQCRNSLQNRTLAVRDPRTAFGCGASRWRRSLRPQAQASRPQGAATAAPWPSGNIAL